MTSMNLTNIVPGANTLLLGSDCSQIIDLSIQPGWSVPTALRKEMPIVWLMKPTTVERFAPNITAQVVEAPRDCDMNDVLSKIRKSGSELPNYTEMEGAGPQADPSGWLFSYTRGQFSVNTTAVYTETYASSFSTGGKTGLCIVQFSCAKSDIESVGQIRQMSDSIIFNA